VTALVDVRDLLVKRDGRPALRLEHLAIKRGEVLAIVGPNGAGKTTLLLSLARLLKPERGEISFGGRRSDEMADTEYRRRIALVMQAPLLFDTTVFANVAAGLRFRGLPAGDIRQRVPLWLERLGAGDLAERRASQLSGGEARRVSLARAMVLEPELLLLDEPFSALDPPTRSAILDDLGPLLRRVDTSTVLVTHDLYEARRLAERIAVVIGNRLRQVGTLGELLAGPADESVEAFLQGLDPS
jgi:ABC-type sugar transport system ATPase subunit